MFQYFIYWLHLPYLCNESFMAGYIINSNFFCFKPFKHRSSFICYCNTETYLNIFFYFIKAICNAACPNYHPLGRFVQTVCKEALRNMAILLSSQNLGKYDYVIFVNIGDFQYSQIKKSRTYPKAFIDEGFRCL